MKTYNKGEWSEFYTAIKILSDKQIKVADKDLIPTDKIIKVIQLILSSTEGLARYDLSGREIAILVNERLIKKATISLDEIDDIFNNIIDGKSTFAIPMAEIVSNRLLIDEIKANSYSKSDLNTVSIIPNEITPREIGFSIKSFIGAAPTLLNAAQTTNFIFEVDGFIGNINEINSIEGDSKIMKRLSKTQETSERILFIGMENEKFNYNLRLIDYKFPEIMAYMLYEFYSTKGGSSLPNIAARTIKHLGFETTQSEIDFKIKNFISAVALGMVPSKEYQGNDVNGGCIIVKKDGDLVCFTLYDKNAFNNFLYHNTKFDTASSTRHKFGTLYEQNGKILFKLNLQIRFL